MADHSHSPLIDLAARLGLWKPAQLVARAREALREGELGEARELLGRANRRAPAWAEPLFLLARCTRSEDGPRDAEEELLLAALERDPEHREAERAFLAIRAWRLEPVTRAWHLFHGGRAADALAAFREAYSALGTRIPLAESAQIVAGIGWCHQGMARADWGAEAFLEALAYDPNLAHARKGLGICFYWLGRLEEAEAELSKAIAIEPKLFDALSFIGWCAYSSGEFERARKSFEEARDGNPLLGDARWGLAWSWWKLERVEEAAEAFREAAQLDPIHPSAGDVETWVLPDPRYAALADAWPGSTESEDARSLAGETPENHEPRPLIEALAALAEGRAAECFANLEALENPTPGERWRARLLEGCARLELDAPERALEAFQGARELAPGRAEPAVAAARALKNLGRKKEAVRILSRSLRTTANHPDVAEELVRLSGDDT